MEGTGIVIRGSGRLSRKGVYIGRGGDINSSLEEVEGL